MFPATSLFNCRFSSSRTLRRLASDLPRPLYLARQRYRVASLIPYFIALGASAGAEKRAKLAALPRHLAPRSALRSLSSVALSSAGEYEYSINRDYAASIAISGRVAQPFGFCPHRSGRAAFPHPAPPEGNPRLGDRRSMPGVSDTWIGQGKSPQQVMETIPVQAAPLAATL